MPKLNPYNIFKKKLVSKDQQMEDVISHNITIPFYTEKKFYEIEYYSRLFIDPTDGKKYNIFKPNIIKILQDYNIPLRQIDPSSFNSILSTIPTYLFMIYLLIQHASSYNIKICINIPSEDYLQFDFIYLNTDTYQFEVETTVYENIIKKCKSFDLIVFPIGIYGVYGNASAHTRHANIALIDNKSKTVEYFEPFGVFEQKYDEIQIAFFNFIKTKFDFAEKYTFNKRIITVLQKDDKFCIYWCLYVFWVRIINNNNNIPINIIEAYLDEDGYNNNIDVLTLLILFTERLVETEKLPSFQIIENYTDIVKSVPSGNEYMRNNISKLVYELKTKINNKDFNNVGNILQNLSQYANYIDFEKIINNIL